MGDGDDGPVLRALGRVLGDLADLGYDARWYGLRAADVGAAHGRFRVFLAAVPADADVSGLAGLADQARTASTGRHRHPVASVGGSALTLLPTPKASNNENRSSDWANGPNLGEALALLPTPAVNDMGEGKTVDEWDAWTDRMKTAHGNGNGHGKQVNCLGVCSCLFTGRNAEPPLLQAQRRSQELG